MNISRTKVLKTDVIIIGAGGAGLAAAVAAAEMGAKVILLEKLKRPGGNIIFIGGIFAAESHIQERKRIDARRDELFKIAMDYAHWRINPRIVRAFIDKSGDTIQWLEQMGLIFDDVHAVYPNQVPMVCHFPKGDGAAIVKVLTRRCEELGVQIQCQTTVKALLMSKSGKLSGVIAEKGGQELVITAESVIIATGGYLGNKELLKKYCPSYDENMRRNGLLHMGEGLMMAMEIGAATEGLGLLLAEGPRFDGPRLPRYMSSIADDPRTIWVNRTGERFIDEASSSSHGFESVNALVRQPGKVCYSIFDDELRQDIMTKGPLFASRDTFFTEMEKEPLDLSEKLRREVKRGGIKISDSWDDIANWIGADQRVLHDTIDEYNLFCEHGYDKIFAKERRYLLPLHTPPYYAVKCVAGLLTTIGGIKVNHRMEVLDFQDNPIRGLYAAGTDTGGWVSDTYCVRLTASASSFAINSGRIASENAVHYIARK